MNELLRLVAYARRYAIHLAGSVILMAIAGAVLSSEVLPVTADPAQVIEAFARIFARIKVAA